MPGHESRRRCRQCGKGIRWSAARFVGARTFCGEPCVLVWLTGTAARTAWKRAVLEMDGKTRGLRWRARWAALQAGIAQHRLNRRLNAHPRACRLPWLWLPSWRGAMAFLVVLAACGVSGGRAPDTAAIPPSVKEPAAPSPVEAGPSLAASLPSPAPPAADGHGSARAVPTVARAPRPAGSGATPLPSRALSAPSGRSGDVTRGDVSVRQIAFTFDGGSEANVTGEILDALRSHNVQATMFLTGQFVRLYPEWVRRMVVDGHEIGNHLDTHPHLTTYETNRRQHTLPAVTRTFVIEELRRAAESFRSVTGMPMAPFWRAPYGEHNPEIRAWAEETGYRHIAWTRGAGTAEDLDTRDWVADRSSRIYHSREEVVERLLSFGSERPEGLNGGIVLMHLGTQRRTDRPHESLHHILRTLHDRGYRLVTISQLLQRIEATTELSSSDNRDSAR